MVHIFQVRPRCPGPSSLLSEAMATWPATNPDAGYTVTAADDLPARHGRRGGDCPPHLFPYHRLLRAGGLYAAADTWCRRPVAHLVGRYPEAAVLGTVSVPLAEIRHSVPGTWLYSATPGHPFWLLVLYLASRATEDGQVGLRRPAFLYSAVRSYRQLGSGARLRAVGNLVAFADDLGVSIPDRLPAIAVLPPRLLHPLSGADDEHRGIIDRMRRTGRLDRAGLDAVGGDAFSITLWTEDW